MEYLLLIAMVFALFNSVIGHVRDIFYGWDDNPGVIERTVENQIYLLQNNRW